MQPSEEIKQRLNIVDLIGEYVQLKKAGVNYKAVCPFHQEKTPSFVVSPVKQIWHCFGCGLGGDIFEFVKQTEGVEFREALQMLAARTGVVLQKPSATYQAEKDKKQTLLEINDLAARFYAKVLESSQSGAEAREYLSKRGFLPATLQKWQIGFAPEDFHTFENFIVKRGFQKKEALEAGLLSEKDGRYFDRFRGRIMFPLQDIHGRVVGFTARVLRDKDGEAKYINSPETLIYSKSQLIYGLNFAKNEIRKRGLVIVVEGNADVITCHEAGYENTVASSGSAFTERQLAALKRYTDNIAFAFDVDAAGLMATRRAVELALRIGFNVSIVSIPSTLAKDPDELIRKDKTTWQKQVDEAAVFLDFYFSEIFAKIDMNSALEKKRAAAEILPLLSLLPDPIDQTHYVKKLAETLDIDEKVIGDLLVRSQDVVEARFDGNGARQREQRPAQDRLEARVLGLLLRFAKSTASYWREFSPEDFSIPLYREIFESASSVVDDGIVDLKDLRTKFDKHSQTIDLLAFGVENELSVLPDWKIEDIAKSWFSEFKRSVLKNQMKSLTARIRMAEESGFGDQAKTLSAEFHNLSKERQKYDAS